MNYFFLDSNIVYNNWYLHSGDFKLLFNYIENTNSLLLISELVCEEVNNLQNKELTTCLNLLKKEQRNLSKLLDQPISFSLENICLQEYDFRKIIFEKAPRIHFLGYNEIKHCDVVKRAFNRTRPFQESEKGYRDTLIWLSLLDYLKKNNIKGKIFFVTNNKSDFFNKLGGLHQDLKNDIETFNLSCNIIPFNSLFDFINKEVDKNEHEFSISELQENYLNDIDRELEIEAIEAINSIPDAEFMKILEVNGLRPFPEVKTLLSHRISLFEGVEDPEVISFSKISDKTIYVSFRYNLRICDLEYSVPTSEYFENRQPMDLLNYELIKDEYATSFKTFVKTYLDASFTFDLEHKLLDGFKLENIYFKQN